MYCVVFITTMLLNFVLLSHPFVCWPMPPQDVKHQTPLVLCRCMFLHNDATNEAKRRKILLLKAFVSASDGNKSTGMKQQWKLSLNSWWPEPREQKSIDNIRSMAKTDFFSMKVAGFSPKIATGRGWTCRMSPQMLEPYASVDWENPTQASCEIINGRRLSGRQQAWFWEDHSGLVCPDIHPSHLFKMIWMGSSLWHWWFTVQSLLVLKMQIWRAKPNKCTWTSLGFFQT